MISEHFEKIFKERIGFDLTDDQLLALNKLSRFSIDLEQNDLFLLKGYAGTGKTTLMNGLVKATSAIKIRTILLAPTGRAAKVLSKITGKQALTIHKKIYKQKSKNDSFGNFVLTENLHKNTLFIVDEASMIANQNSGDQSIFGTGRLLDDLIQYIYSGERCKLILIGDTAQLPPVKLSISPALSVDTLKIYGKKVVEHELKTVVRQESNSGILWNATELRRSIEKEQYLININHATFEDVNPITGDELIDTLNQLYDKHGIEQTIVICRSNKRANLYNNGIRNSVLYREERLSVGDLLMVVKNNYFWTVDDPEIDFIANGDIGEVTQIFGYENIYGFEYAEVGLKLIDYDGLEVFAKILLNTLSSESPALSMEENKTLFYSILEDYSNLKTKKQQYKETRENPYFNALQVKYAYAITCHKAQGGQWANVLIDQGYLIDEMIDKEYLRWLYTAFTRPTERLFLVNFNQKYLSKD
ncbi:MAG: AAA family ATPase [Bacteroidales bacterium]|nr:AAA family ATPase [Bacteroidales bacterium]